MKEILNPYKKEKNTNASYDYLINQKEKNNKDVLDKTLKDILQKNNIPLKNEPYQLKIDPIVKPKVLDLSSGLNN